jgi:hypothetical protein
LPSPRHADTPRRSSGSTGPPSRVTAPRPSDTEAVPAAAVPTRPRAAAWPVAVAAAIAAVACLVPFHRGLRFPFALDDYSFLMPAAGLEEVPFSLRRWLSVRGYYEAALALFGPTPLEWHLVGFALHVANATWVFVLARRLGAGRAAAWVAAGLFAGSPLAFTITYWIACIQELGSCFFLLTATWLLMRRDRWRLASVPVFAAAVLCKESVLAAPLALAFVLGPRVRRLAAVQLAIGVALFFAAGLGARMWKSDPTLPYATAYDTTLLVNLATQLVWFLAPWRPYPDRLAAPQPGLVLPALAVVAAAVVVLVLRRGRGARPLLQARSGSWRCCCRSCRCARTPTPTTRTCRRSAS